MQRLQIDQTVTLSLDEVPETIACRVLEVHGSVGRLAQRGELPPQAVGRLVLGSAGYLLFDEFGLAVGLRVAVRASPPYLDVAIMDGVAMAERRAAERVKVVARAGILIPEQEQAAEQVKADEPVGWTHTIDLSEGGALLRDHPALDGHRRVGLALTFGNVSITARAEIVRRVQDAVGLAFDSIAADDTARLAEFLDGIRHQRRASSRN